MSIENFKGAIFDLDGVITQTAATHFKAWKTTFDEYLKEREKVNPEHRFEEFTKNDYLVYVDGKPRYKGVMAFLDSRGIELPYGDETDKPDKNTITGIGNRKNQEFRKLVDEEGVKIYDSSVDFVNQLIEKGIRVSVASSSINCRFILEKTGLLEKFETVVGGIKAKEKQLKGKPEPDIFITAAEEMGLNPNECIMVEDAISGVKAGEKGNFSCIIAVSREDNRFDLRRYGGDFIVNDLSELSWNDLKEWYEKGLYEDNWRIKYFGFIQSEEKLRETLTTIGNGYFATRGCLEGEKAYKDVHYPGTYIAGLFNKVPTVIHGKKIYNNDFVNVPNWLRIDFRIGDGTYLDILKTNILFYHHELNMKEAVMRRKIKFEDDHGNITTIESERFASMNDPHLALLRYTITPHNYYEPIYLRSFLDGTIINDGVPRYRSLSSNHLDAEKQEVRDGNLFLHVKTNQSRVDIFMYSKHNLYRDGEKIEAVGKVEQTIEAVKQKLSFEAKQNQAVSLEKIVSISTSQDMNSNDPEQEGLDRIKRAGSFDSELDKHKKQWSALWSMADFVINGDRFAQKAVRLHIYHLLVTASLHNKNIDAGIPARGLHGEAYRGHIFWDELFVLPFYNLHFPEISKAALMYRYRRLDAARDYAREHGYEGAMYPWQTANDGYEETQKIHYNPVSGEWDPDLSRKQKHVSLAIAYNVLNYCRSTHDREFMHKYGAEMMFEIARFWASIAQKSDEDNRYHIRKVMGPDEFQEKYPGADEGGIDDNAYTNVMTSWLLNKMIHLYRNFDKSELNDIKEKTGINDQEVEKWKDIRDKLYVEFNDDGILAQFKGYFDLEELDWDKYNRKYKDSNRMDRILKAEGDSPDKYKVAKQADTLMLFYTLSPVQVKKVLSQMGYDVGDPTEFLKKNYEYYIRRTSHGSTLSYVVHAAILKYLKNGKDASYSCFKQALESDIYDSQGGTTKEGIHTGVMAGTLDIIVESFAGIEMFSNKFDLKPSFPAHWRHTSFRIHHRNRTFEFNFFADEFSVKSLSDYSEPFYINYNGDKKELKPHETVTFSVKNP